jgi:excisionase family DNA binding protein
MPETAARGFTVADAAKLLRVSEDKIRRWVKSGELAAINTSGRRASRPRFIILPDAIEQFAAAVAGHAAQAATAKKADRRSRLFPGSVKKALARLAQPRGAKSSHRHDSRQRPTQQAARLAL